MEPKKTDENNSSWENLNLNYSGNNSYASFFPSKSNIHSYPAKLVPNLVFTLLSQIKKEHKIRSVLDPFVGSGTTALESKYLGLDFYGSDLNPLANLIARTKVLTLSNRNEVVTNIENFIVRLQEEYKNARAIKMTVFHNIEYWFKENTIRELSFLKEKISHFLKDQGIENRECYALILLNAFSSSIRMCSLSRNSEFKLYRKTPSEIKKFDINAIEVFSKNVISLIEMLTQINNAYKNESVMEIVLDNAKELKFLQGRKVDLVLTSPPYGDSKSTVAYGQFSRLPLQWMSDLLYKYLGIRVYSENCDEYLLGGKKSKIIANDNAFIDNSNTMKELICKMDKLINEEVRKLKEMKLELIALQKDAENDRIINKEDISNDLFGLLKERVRLDFYRVYNEDTSLSRKEVKKLSIENTEHFFSVLSQGEESDRLDNMELLKAKMKPVKDTINRKILSVSRRKDEVLNFFRDLYQVVVCTNETLNKHGFQAWIVGHRTVLGKININMREILSDWFSFMGYEKVTDLTREYSFKRLPYYINSTANRNDQIKTMMEEYILIVRKP